VGLNVYPEPVTGVALAFLTALLLYTVMFSLSPKIRRVTPINVHTFKLFWKAGVCNAIGWLFMFYAIQYGDVTVVTPLLQIQPLFILIFTYFYLKKLETLSKQLVLGTVIIVLGVILITAFKGN
jgi:drug/metabolite transporter (DMT)-like permease